MDSDNPREQQPQELENARRAMRAHAEGRSMEEWRANIEREITGRMPFLDKVMEAHYTDRRWNGQGLYADFAQQAMKMLRDEYLSARDLVAHRWGVPARQVSAEGLHVRVRPGTTGIPSIFTAARSAWSTWICRPRPTLRRLRVR